MTFVNPSRLCSAFSRFWLAASNAPSTLRRDSADSIGENKRHRTVGAIGLTTLIIVLITAGLALAGWGMGHRDRVGPRATAVVPTPPPDTTYFLGPVQVYGSFSGTFGNYLIEGVSLPVQPGVMYRLRMVNGTADGQHRVLFGLSAWSGMYLKGNGSQSGGYVYTDDDYVFEAIIAPNMATDTLVMSFYGPPDSYAYVSVIGVPDPKFAFFGESTFVRPSSGDTTYTAVFTKPADAAPPYYVFLRNGDSVGANRPDSGWVKVNGTSVFPGPAFHQYVGSQEIDFSPTAGPDTLEVRLSGQSGDFTRLRLVGTDTTPPAVGVSVPAESLVTSLDSLTTSGSLSDRTALRLTVNGTSASVTSNTSFTKRVGLAEGWNTLTFVATDGSDKSTTVVRHVKRDTQAPAVTLSQPAESTYTKNATVTVSGTFTDASSVTANTNGTGLTVVGTGFSGSVGLSYGANTLLTTVTDQAGNQTALVQHVFRDTLPPTLTVSAPSNGASTSADSITVSGTVSDASPLTVAVNGINAAVVSGAFSRKVALSNGSNTITTVATDAAGNQRTDTRSVTRSTAPDSVVNAPPLAQSVASTIGTSTSFLYTGADPIQTGVAPGTILPQQAAVIRGKVLDSLGGALAGATVSVLDHAELGQTLSRADGMYDLAVNGGARLTVEFQKTGYLKAQRTLDVPWQDYIWTDSVAMVTAGPVAGTVTFTSPMQVIRADSVQDASGGRRPSLMFRDSTLVTATLHNDSTVPISGPIAVRVQEFTVGELGAARMPAALPPTSAYTYAVALNVDSALKLDAKKVTFSKPVSFYTDNFLNIPVGALVPVGSYDSDQGQWVPEADGRVIKVLSITNGIAALAVDSAGGQATSGQLAALGIDSLELTRIASTYPVNKTLWRVTTNHFSWLDLNYGLRLPSDARPPNGARPVAAPRCPYPDNRCGSVIGVQAQTLGEAVPVVGTPYALHYQSDRVPGYGPDFGIDIPLRGDTIPASVDSIVVQIEIAGRKIDTTFSRSTFRVRYVWDGKDVYGRYVQGRQPYTIRIGFRYEVTYSVAYSGGGGGGSGGTFGGYYPESIVVGGRRRALLAVEWRGVIGPWNAIPLGLGGWTLSAHHSYDPNSRSLFLGDGRRVDVVSVGNTLEEFAGSGAYGFSGDGGSALAARLAGPIDVAAAPDGSVYIAEESNARIRKVSPSGIISTFAGNGGGGYSGDGGAATSAQIGDITGVAVGPDGSVYLAQRAANAIRRVLPNGTIVTFAGTGTAGFSGDGGPASSAQLNFPYDVAVGPDGSVYIADQGNHRVRKVGPDGIIRTVVGNGLSGYSGNGGSALNARLYVVTSVAVAPDGTLYLSSGSGAVRRVGIDGIITHFAGVDPNTGIYLYTEDGHPAAQTSLRFPDNVAVGPDGTVYLAERVEDADKRRGMRVVRVDPATSLVSTVAGNGTRACGRSVGGSCKQGDDGTGGLAFQAYLYGPTGMTIAPNGDLIFADGNGDKIRRITTATPGLALGTMLIASPDGGLVYEFDSRGQHQHTRDALTGKVILSFGYDSLGLVSSIADSNNNVTTITRDGTGKPTLITAPFGQRTTLTADATTRLLTSIANPGGETVRLWSRSNGLLDSLADPKNQKHRFTYDSIGQLIRDDSPDGSFTALSRTAFVNTKTSGDTGYQVQVTSAAGRINRYAVEYLPSGQTQQTNTDPAGFKTTKLFEQGKTTLPDSTVVTTVESGDPRWGKQAPTLRSLTVKLPSGLTSTVLGARHDSLNSFGDPLSLFRQTDSVSLNGKWTVSTFTASTRRLVQTSPTGRQLFATLDVQGRVVAAQVAGLDSVRFTYDNRGRLSQEIDGGRTTRYGYNANSGRLDSIIDPLGRLTRFTYDSGGRVKTQILPDDRIIAFAYDSNGNLTSLTPPSRPAHGFQYTAADLARQYDPPPLSGVAKPTKYFYNLDRQVDSIVRPDSIAIKFKYDAAGRPDTVHFDRGYLRFGYSATTGNLTSIRSPGSDSLKFTYDGSLPKSVSWKGSVTGSVSVKYNSDFRVDSQYVNGTNGVGFVYDNDGLLTQVGGLKLGRNNSNGLLTADTLGPIRTAYGYTSRGELKGYQVKRSSAVLFGVGYIRDSLGRITQLFDTTQGTPTRWSYVYDGVGRLVADSVNGTLSHGFTYDSNGNRLTYTANGIGTTSYAYDNQDRLTSSSGMGGNVTYSYTSNGELTRKIAGSDTTRYTYDVLGNLVKVILPNHDSIEYLIDGQNRRVGRKLNGAVTNRWLYQNQLNPVAELDSAGNVVSRFVYGSRLNVPDYMIKGGSVYRLITDHLGSVRLVVDTATGTVAQWAKYDEWGVVTADSGAGFQPFGFAGGITDLMTGLTRFGFRDYDAQTGRWTAKDPIGVAGADANLLEYAFSDAINFSDFTGTINVWRVISGGVSIGTGWIAIAGTVGEIIAATGVVAAASPIAITVGVVAGATGIGLGLANLVGGVLEKGPELPGGPVELAGAIGDDLAGSQNGAFCPNPESRGPLQRIGFAADIALSLRDLGELLLEKVSLKSSLPAGSPFEPLPTRIPALPSLPRR